MLTDAANIIFQYAKRRCYVMSSASKPAPGKAPPPKTIDLTGEDYEWAIMEEMEAEQRARASGKQQGRRKPWLPEGMEPVLEELPKWHLLADVLHEIEEEMIRRQPMLSSRTSLLARVRQSCSHLAQSLRERTQCS